jgi:ATP-binding cassette subfamily B protein
MMTRISHTQPENKKHTVFKIYAKEVAKYPWLFFAAVIGIVLGQVADLASPLYLKQFINTIASGHPTAVLVQSLLYILVMISIFYLLDWISSRILFFSLIYAEAKIVANLYDRAFAYLIGHSSHFFSSQFSGTLTRRVSKFANAFENLYDSIMMQFTQTIIFVTGAVVILFIRNHVLGLVLGVWAVFFVLFQFYVAKLQRPLRTASSQEDSKLTGTLADAISNQITISLFSGTRFEQKRFTDAAQNWKRVTMRSWKSNEYIWASLAFLTVIINIVLLAGAVYFWQKGQLTVGDFVLIQAYLLTTIQQLIGINRNLRRFYDSYADANEMVTILNEPHDVKDVTNAPDLSVTDRSIVFDSVSFYFVEDRTILKDFSMNIPGGQKVALVGPSGAGKSTITKLLLRLYDVRSGSICIDGQVISEVTQDSLRTAIGFVPQEPILFHRSLMENIRYGRRGATNDEVMQAAKKANCHDFIMGFPDKYDTLVGERGVKLSGGERQRVAIARAILKNAPILILDEATSSLDSESESLIQDALAILMEGKTVVVIAHRLSTIMKMDRIIVIENGAIAADGTHNELLEQGGLYKKLWSIQAGGFIADEED